jgi:large subunit ribosomal protein L21e
MTKKSRGFRHGTRQKLSKKRSERLAITKFLQKFKVGDKVVISQQPSSQDGMPFPRFKGRTAIVAEVRGRGYVLEVKDGNKKKFIISRPEHLKKA